MKYPILVPIVIVLALVVVPAGLATAPQDPTLQIPHTFQSGDPALASEVNANFAEVQTHSNEMSQAIDDLSLAVDELAQRFAGSENLVTVAPNGGDFSSVSEALAFAGSVAGQISERVVVLALPGTYAENATVVVPSDVVLMGTSRTGTLLRVQASPALDLADGAEVASLSVQNTLNAETVVGIRVDGAQSGALIEDVRVLAPDPETFITGIGIYDSVATMRDIEVLLGDVGSIGVQVGGSSTTTTNVVIESSLIEAGAFGLDAFLDCEVTIRQSVFRALTPIFAHFDGTVVSIQGSDVATSNDGTVINASQNAEVFLGGCRVAGQNPVVSTGGNVRFVHCYKDDYTAIVNGNNSSTE